MEKCKIAVTLTSFSESDSTPADLLQNECIEVVKNDFGRKLSNEETLNLCAGCAGILAGTETYTADILDKFPQLRVISRCGAGVDNIDLDTAKRRGIKVFNTPDAPTLAVAEFTIGLILNLLRKANQADSAVKHGKWKKETGNLLCDKKVGIIGFGRIGRKVAEFLKPFNCAIAYSDPYLKEDIGSFKKLKKEELLAYSDIVSLHASSKEMIIGERELALMKKGSWLINTARGCMLDEDALYKYLKNGHLGGAALDVFKCEPYSGPMKELDNVILTPHIGSYAKEARVKMEIEAVKNLLKGLTEQGGK